MLYAASLPERTEALVLVNTGPRLLADAEYPWGFPADQWHPDLDGIVDLWTSGGGSEAHITAVQHDPWWRAWYATARRQPVSPTGGLAMMRMLGQIDVRKVVRSIRAPTLIVHRVDNGWWPIEGARWLADELPNAQLVELPGADNLWWSGDADRVIDEIERFLPGAQVSRPSERELVTIVFTDLVDSTRQASALGDSRWRALLDGHDEVTVAATERHGGTVVKHTGDGYLLRFDGPAVAIRAAEELQSDVERLGLRVRIAIHTGEAEKRGDDLSGVAVHLAARVLGIAEAGDVLVTGVVKGLVAGSRIDFDDRGRHSFKGLDDSWEVWAVRPGT